MLPGIALWGNVSGLGSGGRPYEQDEIYAEVRAAAEQVAGLKHNEVFARLRTPAVGGD